MASLLYNLTMTNGSQGELSYKKGFSA